MLEQMIRMVVASQARRRELKAMIGKRFSDVGEPRCPKRYLRRNCKMCPDYWASNLGV